MDQQQNLLIMLLRERLSTAVNSLTEYEENVGGPLDQIEHATRIISRNDRIADTRKNPEFRSEVIKEVMESMSKTEKGKNAYKEITNNKYQMLQAIMYSPYAIEYASDRLKEDPMFLIEAVKLNPNLMEYDMIKQFRNENPGFNKHIERIEKEQKLATLQREDKELDNEISVAREEVQPNKTDISRDE